MESSSEMSLVGGTRGKKVLIINNPPDREFADSGDTCPLLEISLLEEGVSGIFGAAVAGGARFFMSSMDGCNTVSHTQARGLRDELPRVKGGA